MKKIILLLFTFLLLSCDSNVTNSTNNPIKAKSEMQLNNSFTFDKPSSTLTTTSQYFKFILKGDWKYTEAQGKIEYESTNEQFAIFLSAKFDIKFEENIKWFNSFYQLEQKINDGYSAKKFEVELISKESNRIIVQSYNKSDLFLILAVWYKIENDYIRFSYHDRYCEKPETSKINFFKILDQFKIKS